MSEDQIPLRSTTDEDSDNELETFIKFSRKRGKFRISFFKTPYAIQILICVGSIFLGFGFIAGFIATNFHFKKIIDKEVNFQDIATLVNGSKIKEFLSKFTDKAHFAGSSGDNENAAFIESSWRSYGLKVESFTYNVFLSFPNQSTPNKFMIINSKDKQVIYKNNGTEKPLYSKEESDPNILLPYNAYSPSGTVTGSIVYVNYGQFEDFHYLNFTKGLHLEGSIGLVRYGKVYRGDKVKCASQFKLKGLLIYSDPAECSPLGPTFVYPDSVYNPGSGVQRGTIVEKPIGDILTPFYPATGTAYRISKDEAHLPSIPVQPIGYDDAYHIFQYLDGEEVIPSWKGGLDVKYNYGLQMKNNTMLTLEVHNYNQMVNITNIIGLIPGYIEPDRYVLLGNHRDAWALGGVDPSTGTSLMMELSRIFAKLVKDGWKPKRTIIFCSWSGEEFGLIGSTEWIEEKMKNLLSRAVVYLNVDSGVSGNDSLQSYGVPILYDALFQATRTIPNPDPAEIDKGRKTVYDTWLNSFPDTNKSHPVVKIPGTASDYRGFIHWAGIPVIDVSYTYKESGYPLYHTLYDTFYHINSLVDPNFKFRIAILQLWGELARMFADSLILPFNTLNYGDFILKNVDNIIVKYGNLFQTQGIYLDGLEKAALDFYNKSLDFQNFVEKMPRNNPLLNRRINDQMMQLERAFIEPRGLPNIPHEQHVVFAPSTGNSYHGIVFSGLVDLLENLNQSKDEWQEIKKHLSIIIYTLNSASSVLEII